MSFFTFNRDKNKTSVFSDLLAVGRYIKNMPRVFSELSEPELFSTESIDKYYNIEKGGEELSLSQHSIQYSKTQTFSPQRETNNTRMFFINGIMTSEDSAKVNAQMLSNVLNNDIELIYNPTQTLFSDIKESIMARTFGFPLQLMEKTHNLIVQALKSHQKVILIAYSQGAIIGSQVICELAQDERYKHLIHKLELYTFGSAANRLEIPEHCNQPHIEHYANELDFIAQISVLNYRHRVMGQLFTFEDDSHSFSRSYLPNFVLGHYGRDNLLTDYLEKNSMDLMLGYKNLEKQNIIES